MAIVACGPRGDAFRKFKGALERGEKALLLVDSERPVRAENRDKPWAHLSGPPDKWARPESARNEDAHLMAQCMESWLVADTKTLAAYFKRGFSSDKLPGNPDVEEVGKPDILSGLSAAARQARGGGYDKVRDGFRLIGKIDPSRVERRAPHAGRFFKILREKLGAQRNN